MAVPNSQFSIEEILHIHPRVTLLPLRAAYSNWATSYDKLEPWLQTRVNLYRASWPLHGRGNEILPLLWPPPPPPEPPLTRISSTGDPSNPSGVQAGTGFGYPSSSTCAVPPQRRRLYQRKWSSGGHRLTQLHLLRTRHTQGLILLSLQLAQCLHAPGRPASQVWAFQSHLHRSQLLGVTPPNLCCSKRQVQCRPHLHTHLSASHLSQFRNLREQEPRDSKPWPNILLSLMPTSSWTSSGSQKLGVSRPQLSWPSSWKSTEQPC